MRPKPLLERLSRHGLFRPWLTVLAAAVALTLLVEIDALPAEAETIRAVQDWDLPGQALSDGVRALTTSSFVVVMGVLIAVAHRLEGDQRAAMALIVLVVALLAVQAGVKELVDRPRPSEAASGIELRAVQTSPSFPAGHVMGPMAVYGWALVHLLRRARRPGQSDGQVKSRFTGSSRAGGPTGAEAAAAIALATVLGALLALTGIVNVYLGVHWPSDVFGGYLWGMALLLPALMAVDAWQRER